MAWIPEYRRHKIESIEDLEDFGGLYENALIYTPFYEAVERLEGCMPTELWDDWEEVMSKLDKFERRFGAWK
jgi:hypothetical protein